MVIIFDAAQFWIDVLFVNRTSVATGASAVSQPDVSRAGLLLGATCVCDSDNPEVTAILRKQSNAVLTFGQVLDNAASGTTLELVRHNFNAGASAIGAIIVLFMRKRKV